MSKSQTQITEELRHCMRVAYCTLHESRTPVGDGVHMTAGRRPSSTLTRHLRDTNRVRMNIPSSGRAVLDPEGVDGNIHTNWLDIYISRQGDLNDARAIYALRDALREPSL